MFQINIYYRIGLLLGGFCFLVLYFNSLSDCPPQYLFSMDYSCELKDKKKDVKLIELYNFKSKNHKLFILKGINLIQIRHPEKDFPQLSFVKRNSILFKDAKLSKLIVNGKEYPLKYIELSGD